MRSSISPGTRPPVEVCLTVVAKLDHNGGAIRFTAAGVPNAGGTQSARSLGACVIMYRFRHWVQSMCLVRIPIRLLVALHTCVLFVRAARKKCLRTRRGAASSASASSGRGGETISSSTCTSDSLFDVRLYRSVRTADFEIAEKLLCDIWLEMDRVVRDLFCSGRATRRIVVAHVSAASAVWTQKKYVRCSVKMHRRQFAVTPEGHPTSSSLKRMSMQSRRMSIRPRGLFLAASA
mmetsp:Transcript_10241/g.30836  ORF Transcript_10241/g.30836 Transcript_10241/m.30836 type:complete len:235 (+) Transcript_10241:1147-1851(+)